MAQMTDALARDELKRIHDGDAPMLTRHEIEQLLRAWLERDALREALLEIAEGAESWTAAGMASIAAKALTPNYHR